VRSLSVSTTDGHLSLSFAATIERYLLTRTTKKNVSLTPMNKHISSDTPTNERFARAFKMEEHLLNLNHNDDTTIDERYLLTPETNERFILSFKVNERFFLVSKTNEPFFPPVSTTSEHLSLTLTAPGRAPRGRAPRWPVDGQGRSQRPEGDGTQV